jgi:hypothetical protein
MPARPRAGRRVARRELDVHHLCQLCLGHVFFRDTGFHDEVDMLAGWQQVGASLLAWHVEECPGSRPWAWWRFEAPEPRRLYTGKGHVCPVRQRHGAHADYFGAPHVYGCTECFIKRYESQAAYLRRMKLLLPQEDALIPQGLAACDRWWRGQYGDYEDHPTRRGMDGFRDFLATYQNAQRVK